MENVFLQIVLIVSHVTLSTMFVNFVSTITIFSIQLASLTVQMDTMLLEMSLFLPVNLAWLTAYFVLIHQFVLFAFLVIFLFLVVVVSMKVYSILELSVICLVSLQTLLKLLVLFMFLLVLDLLHLVLFPQLMVPCNFANFYTCYKGQQVAMKK